MRRRSFIATLPIAATSPALAGDHVRPAPGQAGGGSENPWTDLNAGETTDLGSVASRNVRLFGGGRIASFGQAPDGTAKTVLFTAAARLKHDPSSLILPNHGVDLPVAAGDSLTAVSLGGGGWIVTAYQPCTVSAKIDRTAAHGAFAFKYALGQDAETIAPDFAVDGGTDRTKTYMKSAFLADPGDTPELGLIIGNGTAHAPVAARAPSLGAFIYGWPIDNTGGAGAQMGPGFGDSQWLGRNCQITFGLAGDPTPTSRPGAMAFGVCPPGKQIPIERGWFSPRGGFVLTGRAVENAIAAGVVSYPWARGGAAKYHPAPGLNWHEYADDATLTLIASDTSDNKVMAVRRSDDLGRGAGFDYLFASDELRLGRYDGGSFRPIWGWSAAGDQVPAAARSADLGSQDRPVRTVHADSLDIRRARRGPAAYIESGGADYSGEMLSLSAARPAGEDFHFMRAAWRTGGGEETAAAIDGEGRAAIAGALVGEGSSSGAFMEWADGNPGGEDRVGWCVVLEGRRIRRARPGDPPHAVIGVVTARAQVTADAAWRHWAGRYQTDELGRPLTRLVEHVRWSEPVMETRMIERRRTVTRTVRRPRLERVEVVERSPRLEEVDGRWVERMVETRRMVERPATLTVVVHGEDGLPILDGAGAPRTARVPVHEDAEEEHAETWLEPVEVETGRTEHCYRAGAVPAGLTPPADAQRFFVREKLPNSAFDPSRPYQPRSRRPEWDVVAFSGPELVRRGEVVGDRWIRMRSVADGVEEWLVR